MKYLFVYGTLRNQSERLLGAPFIGTVYTKTPCNLYLDDGIMCYPALVKAEDGISIRGELYLVDDYQLEELDEYEDSPDLFKLEKIEIKDQGHIKFSELEAYTYVYQESVDGLPKIEGNEFIS